MNFDALAYLAMKIATTAVFSIGGIATMIPEIHRLAVDQLGWMTDAQFAEAFAISQIAPGPNIMIMSMIGWRVAGVAGMITATAATVVPTSLIAMILGRAELRVAQAPWYKLLGRSLPPLVVGLIGASGVVTGQASIHSLAGLGIAVGVAAYVASTKSNPLIPIFVAIFAGVAAGRMGWL